MAVDTGTFPPNSSSNSVATGVTAAANFIPEVWQNEVFAEMQKMLVARNAVRVLNHRGKKGDVIHIPTPERQDANDKAQHDAVTLIEMDEPEKTVTLNQHKEYSKLIEDIAGVQAISSMRSFYTEEAAYAISKAMDTYIHTQAGDFNKTSTAYDGAVIGGDGSTAWDGSANTNTGNGTAITDAGIRKAIQTLDDNDMPMTGRSLLVPPVARNSIFGIDKFVTQSNVGEVGRANTIRNGVIGDIYGVSVAVSSNCATVAADDTTTNYRVCVMLHESAIVLAEQIGVRVQAQYKLEFLANLLTADAVYGATCVRSNSGSGGGQGGVALFVPA